MLQCADVGYARCRLRFHGAICAYKVNLRLFSTVCSRPYTSLPLKKKHKKTSAASPITSQTEFCYFHWLFPLQEFRSARPNCRLPTQRVRQQAAEQMTGSCCWPVSHSSATGYATLRWGGPFVRASLSLSVTHGGEDPQICVTLYLRCQGRRKEGRGKRSRLGLDLRSWKICLTAADVRGVRRRDTEGSVSEAADSGGWRGAGW